MRDLERHTRGVPKAVGCGPGPSHLRRGVSVLAGALGKQGEGRKGASGSSPAAAERGSRAARRRESGRSRGAAPRLRSGAAAWGPRCGAHVRSANSVKPMHGLSHISK